MKQDNPEVRFMFIEPDKLKSDGLNPNKMSPKELIALKQSIVNYGFITPIIVNENFVIADGEQRWQASKELKLKQIPIAVVNLKEIDRKIIRQVMNKLHGSHDPILDLNEFAKINDLKGLKELEKLTFIPQNNIADLLKLGTDRCLIDAIDKRLFYGEQIAPNEAIDINVDKIKPNTWNPTNLGNVSYNILKKSIGVIGLLNPIVVRHKGNGFEIVDGECRWRAVKELGHKTIQAKIINVNNELEAKAICFSLNKIKGKLSGDKATALVNKIRAGIKDNKRLQALLGLDKKKLDRYLAFGEDGVFFTTPTGLNVRQYTEDEYDEKKPYLIITFSDSETLNKVKAELEKYDKNISKALVKVLNLK